MSGQAAVVITTYNHARFLSEAIESVRRQTVAAAEVVVVDDGSSDHPELVVKRYPFARLIWQENRGLAAARNRGWRATKSPFVCFLDADDWLRPEALEIGLRQLAAHQKAAFNYGAYANHYWPSGRIVEVPFRPVPPDAFGAMLRVNTIGMHATVLYRRSALEGAGGFAEELRACEDYELYLRIAEVSPVACSPHLLADYRQHDSNMSRDHAAMLRTVLRVMSSIEPAARAQGMIEDWKMGVRDWRAWYVDNWAGERRSGALDTFALKQSASMLSLAPGLMIAKMGRYVARRLAGR